MAFKQLKDRRSSGFREEERSNEIRKQIRK
jgi:hypothetical protein